MDIEYSPVSISVTLINVRQMHYEVSLVLCQFYFEVRDPYGTCLLLDFVFVSPVGAWQSLLVWGSEIAVRRLS
jgi:hypothetical protein